MHSIHSVAQLQKLLANPGDSRVFKLTGKFKIDRITAESLIDIDIPGITIDGYDAMFEVHLSELFTRRLDLIKIAKEATETSLKGLNIQFIYDGPYSEAEINVISNFGKNTLIEDCRISVKSAGKKVTGINCAGGINTTLETPADNCIISDNYIHVDNSSTKEDCAAFGIFNELANSVSITGSDIIVNNNSQEGQAVALFNSGRFLLVYKNTLQAIVDNDGICIGVYNNGMYMMFSRNSILINAHGKSYGYVCPEGSYTRISDNDFTAAGPDCTDVSMPAVKCLVLSNLMNTDNDGVERSYGTMICNNACRRDIKPNASI